MNNIKNLIKAKLLEKYTNAECWASWHNKTNKVYNYSVCVKDGNKIKMSLTQVVVFFDKKDQIAFDNNALEINGLIPDMKIYNTYTFNKDTLIKY